MAAIHPIIDGVLQRRRRSLARAITLIEKGVEQDLRELSAGLHGHTGGAHLVGITGSPGAGKSTLTNALTAVLRGRGQTVAVLAIDPSSPFSGGALLGDRVRMGEHAADDGVFIRSMATRGHLGGLSWAAPQAMTVLDAAGFDVVIVETVGVGQAEIEIAELADTTVVVQAPGMGDAIQASKAGILEVADIHVINKGDLPGADRTAREMRRMLALAEPRGWTVPIITTTASTGADVEALADLLGEHHRWAQESGHRAERRRGAAATRLQALVAEIVRRRTRQQGSGSELDRAVDAVLAAETDPWAAADAMVDGLAARPERRA